MESVNFVLMSFRKLLLLLKFVCTRVAFAFVVFFIITHAVIDFEKIKFGLNLRQLNFMMPTNYDYLLDLEKKHQPADREKIRGYIEFYLKVIEVLPERADAYGMLGFCYYYLGDFESAVKAYQEALRLKPEEFWFSYNLGAIYYNLKAYSQARVYFNKSTSYDLNQTYSYILNSREIYMPILKKFDKPEVEVQNRLVEAYQFSKNLNHQLTAASQNKSVSLPAQLVVRIF